MTFIFLSKVDVILYKRGTMVSMSCIQTVKIKSIIYYKYNIVSVFKSVCNNILAVVFVSKMNKHDSYVITGDLYPWLM